MLRLIEQLSRGPASCDHRWSVLPLQPSPAFSSGAILNERSPPAGGHAECADPN